MSAIREVIDELDDFSRYCRNVSREAAGPGYILWAQRSAWAERLAQKLVKYDRDQVASRETLREGT